LWHQFFWMALQSIEKYLKGILLFSRKPTKGIDHDLTIALGEAKKLAAVDLQLRAELEKFVQILNEQGPNRYFEKNLLIHGQEILLLDELVWHLRVRCVALDDDEVGNGIKWNSRDHFQEIKKCLENRNWNRIRVPYGLLEQILTSKSEARKDLIWKNFYFGSRKKRRVKLKNGFHFHSSRLVITPEIFPELDKLVKFPKKVREHFQSPTKKMASLQQWRVQW